MNIKLVSVVAAVVMTASAVEGTERYFPDIHGIVRAKYEYEPGDRERPF